MADQLQKTAEHKATIPKCKAAVGISYLDCVRTLAINDIESSVAVIVLKTIWDALGTPNNVTYGIFHRSTAIHQSIRHDFIHKCDQLTTCGCLGLD